MTSSPVSGILFSNSVLSVPYLVFKTNPLASILFTFSTNLPYAVFFLQDRFLLHYLVSLNQQKQVLFWQYLIYQFQFDFSEKREVSTYEMVLISAFVA